MHRWSVRLRSRTLTALLPVALLAASVGCDERAGPGWALLRAPIYYGTRDPQTLALTEGQKLAVGWLYWNGDPGANFCSATLIADRVVATARHCLEDVGSPAWVGFGVGLYPGQPRGTFRAAALHLHPQVDAALIVLTEAATTAVPGIEPVPVNRVSPASLRGQQVDGAGYGQTHDGSEGRYFAAVWLEYVGASYLRVDGRGEQGLCFGDSGGPLLGPGPVLLGVESGGDQSCVDEDEMTRLDAIVGWVDAVINDDPLPDPCGGLDYLGRCDGAVAEWCDDGRVRRYDCAADGLGCGWVDAETGWYCVEDAPPDPCEGLDALGRCVGQVQEWCEDGALWRRDCAAEGLTCVRVDDATGYGCVATAPACGDVGAGGRCAGAVLEWCADGALQRRDCAAEGLACGRAADDDALDCVAAAPPGCSAADARCDGGVAVRCVTGALVTDDCGARGEVCVHEAAGPPYCRAVAPGPGPDAGGADAVEPPPSGPVGPLPQAGPPATGDDAGSGCQTAGAGAVPWPALFLPLLLLSLRRRAALCQARAWEGDPSA